MSARVGSHIVIFFSVPHSSKVVPKFMIEKADRILISGFSGLDTSRDWWDRGAGHDNQGDGPKTLNSGLFLPCHGRRYRHYEL